jgi:hypothetical protein
MRTNAKTYPDISDILERKAAGRVDLHTRSFAEKLDALDALRDRAEPLRATKAARMERDPIQARAPGMRPWDGLWLRFDDRDLPKVTHNWLACAIPHDNPDSRLL